MLGKILSNFKHISNSIYFRYLKNRKYKYTKQLLNTIDIEKRTMYPHVPRKSIDVIRKEILQLIQKNRDSWTPEMTITQYFFYGCDRLTANIEDYVFQKEYDCARDALNGDLVSLYQYKNIAGVYLNAHGINASYSLGQISPDGNLVKLTDGTTQNLVKWLQKNGTPVFCKPNDGNQGKSCYRIECTNNCDCFSVSGKLCPADQLAALLANHIIEPLIIQHKTLRQFSPNCVNPLRIRTMNDNGNIRHVSTYISIASKDAYVSNGVTSGVMIGLNDEGRCITDGFCEVEGKERRLSILPDTNIRISDIVIPGVREAIELAKAAHRTTPQIFAIGWDVGITDNGPIIIEGNPRYGTCTYQATSGIGERNFFEKEFKSRLK